jgi:hypothetical protein
VHLKTKLNMKYTQYSIIYAIEESFVKNETFRASTDI